MTKRNKSWGEYQTTFFDKLGEWFRFVNILRYFPKSETVLDVGCGYDGKLLLELKQRKLLQNGIGIDLRVSKKKYKNIKLISQSANKKFKVPNSSINTVISLALIEHLDNPSKACAEMYRVLKPGGNLLITTPNKKWKWILDFTAFLGLISKEEINDHKTYFTKESAKQILIDSGFSKKNIQITAYPDKFILDFVILVRAKK